MSNTSDRIALFVDLENFVGFCLELGLPLDLSAEIKKLSEHGRISIRRSFGDIYKMPMEGRRRQELRKMLQSSLVQHEDVPHYNKYKNTADIRLVIEALSIAYTYPDIDIFVVIAHDRDYMPLFSKLREIGKTIIGIGSSRDSVGELYRSSCDIFYYHDTLSLLHQQSLINEMTAPACFDMPIQNGSSIIVQGNLEEAVALLVEAINAVEMNGKKPVGSAVAIMMRNLKSDFDVTDYGLTSFKELCQVSSERGIISISRHGLDLLLSCNDRVLKEQSEQHAQLLNGIPSAEDEDSVLDYYRHWINSKLKINLPSSTERGHIYQHLDAVMSAEDYPVSGYNLKDLSSIVSARLVDSDIDQSTIFKVLYGLFRSRSFTCGLVENPFNPVILTMVAELEDLDDNFIGNMIAVFKREARYIPFNEAVWSVLFVGNDSKKDFIKDVFSHE